MNNDPRPIAGRHPARRTWPALVLATVMAAGAWAQDTWVTNGTDMPILSFINQVAEMTGKTIVVDPRLRTNTVTVFSTTELDADGVYALFLTVLKVHSMGAVENNGVIQVIQQPVVKQSGGNVTQEDAPPDLMITRVMPLDHVPASEVVKTLRPLIPQTGHIAAIDEPNVLLLADYASNLARLSTLVEQMDVVDEDTIIHRPLEHAWVGTVAALLQEIAPEQFGPGAKGPQGVQLVANENNNSLVLKGKSDSIANVLQLIDKLDVPVTAAGAAQVIPLNHAQAEPTATILDNLVNANVGENQGVLANIQPDVSLNALVVRADPATMKDLLAIVAQLDVRRSQVLIEAAIVEFSVDALRAAGVELGGVDARGTSIPTVSTTLDGIVGSLLSRLAADDDTIDPVAAVAAAASPTLAVAKLDRDGISFGAIVTALQTDSRANLLSTPSVLTLDNQEAVNFAGQEIPFRSGSFTTPTDGSVRPFTTVQREQVGTSLTVTPHIYDDDSIRMAIVLSVGNVVDTSLGGFADVVTNERELTTTVLAEDRQIILLGGLITDDQRTSTRRVPLLGDLPVLGRAFRSQSETRIKRYLLMFLRATVLDSGEAAEQAARARYEGIYTIRNANGPSGELEDVFEVEAPEAQD
ncbi:MAG: type II secretion system protein GspD [Gammaproteobacteria bacterium]|nr:type II secretion system protein GspD [Gammaproteobacteria bacterium]